MTSHKRLHNTSEPVQTLCGTDLVRQNFWTDNWDSVDCESCLALKDRTGAAHFKASGFNETACGTKVRDFGFYDLWVEDWMDVNCSNCLEVKYREDGKDRELQDGEGMKDDFYKNPIVGDRGNLREYKLETPQSRRVMILVDEWFGEYVKKSADYETSTGNVSENFGLMGQFMKLTDKVHKLRKPMWDQEIAERYYQDNKEMLLEAGMRPVGERQFNFEGTEEILRDLIGHAFLALDFLEQNKPLPKDTKG